MNPPPGKQKRPRIGVIGSTNVDLVTSVARMPAPGETLAAEGFAIADGGKGANQAVAAARLGADVVLLTHVGDDAFGPPLLRRLAAAGVDIGAARAVPETATGTATILVEPSGENRIMIAAGANATLRPADIDAAEAALESCGLIVLQLEIPRETVAHAARWAKARGIPVLLNPAPAAADLDPALLADVDILVPNQGELARLSGRPTGTVADAEAAARALLSVGLKTIIVTLGGDGALVVEATRATRVAAHAVEVRDTTGAGDAFIGAFAERWVATRDVDAAVAQATLYAAESIRRPGAQAAYADRAAFEAFCLEVDR